MVSFKLLIMRRPINQKLAKLRYKSLQIMLFWPYNNPKVEMSSQKPLLDPYKTIGSFVHGALAVSQTLPFSFATACHHSFKIYSEELAIKMVSPCFEAPVRALALHNEHTYVVVGHTVTKIKYHHVVREWALPALTPKNKNKQHASILIFDGLVLVTIGSTLYLIREPANPRSQEQLPIQSFNLGVSATAMVHPVTYINKVIAYSGDRIVLVNPVSQKMLYDYSEFTKKLLQGDKLINLVCATPLVDIVAVGLSSGEIAILNIRTSKLVFTMKQKRPVTAIAFSQADSLMASGDDSGNIILWDLQNRKIVYRLEAAFGNSVDHLFFIPGLSLLTASSSKTNALRQFRINLDDSRTLTLFRERVGSSPLSPILSLKVQNNKQLTYSTKEQTIFSSLYSHCNMYSLPACLDSALPHHLYAKNFTLELMRERTVVGRLNIHENAQLARFSISGKYVIVCTKSRMLKIAVPSSSNASTVLHISSEWKLSECQELVLGNEQSIFAVCFSVVHVFDFAGHGPIAALNDGQHCYNAVSNLNQTMLALENRTQETIEIWDTRSVTLSRSFKKLNPSNCTRLCFTADNRFLLSSHIDHSLLIWSILQSNLYKIITLESPLTDMCFTPDNGYMLSVFSDAKEINIWHNYIGKITSSQEQHQVYKFHTALNYLCGDFRQQLNDTQGKLAPEAMLTNESEFEGLLDEVEDAPDVGRDRYNFEQVNKWLPLVYYDEIKNRNSINKGDEVPSLPFFLDFKNITEQQDKINRQMKQELRDKRAQHQEKVDSNLQNPTHEITLSTDSTSEQHLQCWQMLSQLSIAQVDYQLRKFLLLPTNAPLLLRLFTQVLAAHQSCPNLMQVHVVLMRVLDLAGSDLCAEDAKVQAARLLELVRARLEEQQDTVDYCVAVAGSAA